MKKEKKKQFLDLNNELIQEMNKKLVNKINDRVKKHDILYILGDFAFGSINESKKWLNKINGQKILIKGNHDRDAKNMLNIGFHQVFENESVWLCDKTGKKSKKVYLSHFPLYPSKLKIASNKILNKLGLVSLIDTRYLYKRMPDFGQIICHGHTHDKVLVNNRQIHVGCEALKCSPISEIEILEIINRVIDI